MDFTANKIPTEVIKEGAFGGTYFREFILVLMTVVQKVMERIRSVK